MNLQTTYMGLKLASPIVVSSNTLSEEVHNIVQMEDAGAGAVVLFSLFEEQIQKENALYEQALKTTTNIFAEAMDYFPDLDEYHVGTTQYLELIRKAKERVGIPIIASLNAITTEGWIDYAMQVEEAGADGLEINVFYIPADIRLTGSEVEQRYLSIISEVRKNVHIPIAVKLNPYFSAPGHMAKQISDAGANALVLFNRFYQPDFDIVRLKVLSNLQYSESNEIRLPLLWIAVLYGKLPLSLAATTGVQSAHEVIKYLLAGADITMTASALYKYGIEHLRTMTNELQDWMRMMGFDTVESFRGVMSHRNVSDPTAYERANYIRILEHARESN
ncbi:MAG: dihydroorotate dehydrogenase-like protein [Saprospiraceae bacterium]|nr:dihydroorotate dehydrogenase-like protein [Saprospiraceae bacterium]